MKENIFGFGYFDCSATLELHRFASMQRTLINYAAKIRNIFWVLGCLVEGSGLISNILQTK